MANDGRLRKVFAVSDLTHNIIILLSSTLAVALVPQGISLLT